MKTLFIFILFLPLYVMANEPMRVDRIQPFEYQNNRISSYLIYATRNDSSFVIISPVFDRVEKNIKLRRRNNYIFDLDTVFPYRGDATVFGVEISPSSPYMMSHGLKPQKKYHYKIYKSKNTNGKYLRNCGTIVED